MRVIVADDHPLYREALSTRVARLFPSAEIVTAASFGEVSRLLTEGARFDLVLVDLWMPGFGPGPAIGELVAACAPAPVILTSGDATSDDVRLAVTRGVKGFLPKTMPPNQLDAALSLLAAGGTYLPTEILGAVATAADTPTRSDQALRLRLAESLTPREQEVLEHLASGRSNKEIGRDIGLSEITIKLHVRQILRKLGARNRSEAASIATRAGIRPAAVAGTA